jgi:thiamine biosynthesis lipoprotein
MAAKRRATRREFLKGRAAVDAVADLTHGTGEFAPEQKTSDDAASTGGHANAGAATPPLPSPYLMRVGRKAMACEFEVVLDLRKNPAAAEAAVEVLDLVDELEDQMTVYREHSEVMAINRQAARSDVEVEPNLFRLLAHALEIYEATDGAFDITSGPLTKAWGFYRRQGRLPSDEEIAEAMRSVGSRHVQLDPERRSIRFDVAGLEINLGGIGKGYALDRAAELLADRGATDFLLHGGQSSVLARGNRGDVPSRQALSRADDDRTASDVAAEASAAAGNDAAGWLIGLKHPLRPRQRMARVRLKDRAMGTSGSGTQFFTHRGKRYGHIIDPRTGQPAQEVISISVLAASAATADALATGLYVMGVEKALDFCARHQDIGAVITAPGKLRGSVELHVVGIGDDDWQEVEA